MSPWIGEAPRRMLEDVGYAVRFLAALPRFLRHPLTPDAARATVRRRLVERETDFLYLMREVIYRRPAHPLRRLLAIAGCEYGDLARLVGREGLEGTLHALFRQGVYLTIDEFKRGRPVVRGRASFAMDPSELLNPLNGRHLPIASGGSRGTPTPASADLWLERDYALARCLYLDAVGATAPRFGMWEVPGTLPIQHLLLYAAAGARPAKWFTQVDPNTPGLGVRYRWSGQLLRWGGLAAGVSMPLPESVPLRDPGPIVRWLAASRRAGEHPVFRVSSSAGVRVCEAALSEGVDLTGALFMLGSEPVTPARLAVIRRSGAGAVSVYGSMDAGFIGEPCAAPDIGDAMHVRDDLLGVIQTSGEAAVGPPLHPKTLLFTSLRPRSVYLLLNVSLGDQAELSPARCGCPLLRAGLSRQLHHVRSFEKLSAGGATLLDVDVIRVLETVLPARFGGGPLDYQLLESVDGDGRAALRLLIHPAVGPLHPPDVVDAFLAALAGDGAERVRELLWRQGDTLRVERVAPHLTPAGKVLHLHQERAGAADAR